MFDAIAVWSDGSTAPANEVQDYTYRSDDYIIVTSDTAVGEIIAYLGDTIALEVFKEITGNL